MLPAGRSKTTSKYILLDVLVRNMSLYIFTSCAAGLENHHYHPEGQLVHKAGSNFTHSLINRTLLYVTLKS